MKEEMDSKFKEMQQMISTTNRNTTAESLPEKNLQSIKKNLSESLINSMKPSHEINKDIEIPDIGKKEISSFNKTREIQKKKEEWKDDDMELYKNYIKTKTEKLNQEQLEKNKGKSKKPFTFAKDEKTKVIINCKDRQSIERKIKWVVQKLRELIMKNHCTENLIN